MRGRDWAESEKYPGLLDKKSDGHGLGISGALACDVFECCNFLFVCRKVHKLRMSAVKC